jgi:hypothetical protein
MAVVENTITKWKLFEIWMFGLSHSWQTEKKALNKTLVMYALTPLECA